MTETFVHKREDFVTDAGKELADSIISNAASDVGEVLQRQKFMRMVHARREVINDGARRTLGETLPVLKARVGDGLRDRVTPGHEHILKRLHPRIRRVVKLVVGMSPVIPVLSFPIQCMFVAGRHLAVTGHNHALTAQGMANVLAKGLRDMLNNEALTVALMMMFYVLSSVKNIRKLLDKWKQESLAHDKLQKIRRCAVATDTVMRVLWGGDAAGALSAFGLSECDVEAPWRLQRYLLRAEWHSRELCDLPDAEALLRDTCTIGTFLDAVIGICSSTFSLSQCCWTCFDGRVGARVVHPGIGRLEFKGICSFAKKEDIEQHMRSLKYSTSCGISPYYEYYGSRLYSDVRVYDSPRSATCTTNSCDILNYLSDFCNGNVANTACVILQDPFQGLSDAYAAAMLRFVEDRLVANGNLCVCCCVRVSNVLGLKDGLEGAAEELFSGAVKVS